MNKAFEEAVDRIIREAVQADRARIYSAVVAQNPGSPIEMSHAEFTAIVHNVPKADWTDAPEGDMVSEYFVEQAFAGPVQYVIADGKRLWCKSPYNTSKRWVIIDPDMIPYVRTLEGA